MAEEIDCACSNDLILLLPLPPMEEPDANITTTFPIDLIVIPNPDLESGQITRFENANQNLYSPYSDTIEPLRIVVELPAKRVKASQKTGTPCCGKTAMGGCLNPGSGDECLELTSRDINLNIQLLLDKSKKVEASVVSSLSGLSVNNALVGCKRCRGGCTNSCIAYCSKPRSSVLKSSKNENKAVEINAESSRPSETSHLDSLVLLRRASEIKSNGMQEKDDESVVENSKSKDIEICPCCPCLEDKPVN